jgi:uncharacterized membrane-anchored protein YhcB (DUF1043 family)
MKSMALIAIVAGLALLGFLIFRNRENFVAEFTDRTNEKATVDNEVSSYRQQTNHVQPTPAQYEPPHGIETPFRVNQYTSYMTL